MCACVHVRALFISELGILYFRFHIALDAKNDDVFEMWKIIQIVKQKNTPKLNAQHKMIIVRFSSHLYLLYLYLKDFSITFSPKVWKEKSEKQNYY